MEPLVDKEPVAEIKHRIEEADIRHSNPETCKSLISGKRKSQVDDSVKYNDNFEIRLWTSKKISFNKSLILMRMALFLWFGAGRLPSLFLSVFMKSRGLTLIEYSSAFSFIFLFLFVVSSVSGVIADKIGRGKPILLFHVIATIAVIVGMLLSPKVSSESCEIQENLNCSSILRSKINSTFCSTYCFQNDSQNYYDKQNAEGNFANETLFGHFGSLMNVDNETVLNDLFEDIDANLCNETCLTLCKNRLENECTKTRNKLVVFLYVAWIFGIFSFRSTAYRFMDFTALCLLSTSDSHFGRERFFAVAGEVVISIFVTFILNIDKSSKSNYNYDSVLWFADVVLLCSLILICFVKVPTLPPGQNILRKASVFSRDVDFLGFAFLVYVAGNGFSFNKNFHFLLLQSMKAPKVLFGVVSITFGLYGTPVLLTSGWWLKKLGTHKIFVLSLLCYSVNHALYSFLYNPWLVVLIEVTNAFTFHLFWVAVVIHCKNTAPQGFIATLTTVAGTLHFGIGRSSGVFIGGMMINYLGQRTTYRVTSSFFLLMAISYSIFFSIRGKSHKMAVTAKEKEDPEIKMTEIDNNKQNASTSAQAANDMQGV